MERGVLSKLEKNKPSKEHIMVVNTINHNQRKLIHEWAQQNGFVSLAAKVGCFERVVGYFCRECKWTYYEDEIRCYCDEGSNSEWHLRCRGCDNTYYKDDAEWDCLSFKLNSILNAVVVGNSTELLKKKAKSNRRKRREKSENTTISPNYKIDISALLHLKIRNFTVLPRPRWDLRDTFSLHPRKLINIACTWWLVCKYFKVKLSKDLRFLILEYVAENWWKKYARPNS